MGAGSVPETRPTYFVVGLHEELPLPVRLMFVPEQVSFYFPLPDFQGLRFSCRALLTRGMDVQGTSEPSWSELTLVCRCQKVPARIRIRNHEKLKQSDDACVGSVYHVSRNTTFFSKSVLEC